MTGSMAVLEQIARPSQGEDPGTGAEKNSLPALFWQDNTPWREVNLWISQKKGVDGATLKSLMTHLLAYAKWLEQTNTDWWDFPVDRAKRCLVLYRAFLLREIGIQSIKPRTAAARMRAIVQFYRWAHTHRVISPEWPMWEDRHIGVRVSTNFGFERTILKLSTDLRIRAGSTASSIALEDNLVPFSVDDQVAIQAYARRYGTEELQLFFSLGFRTGLRLGTISDLKVQTLYRATPDPNMTGFMRISIGPRAQPPVATKNGVNGTIPLHQNDLDALIEHATSTGRLKRAERAAPHHRDLLFLTRSGQPYAGKAGVTEYRAMEMEISRLRSRARRALFAPMYDFKFHRTRATFGTNTARLLLGHLSVADALGLLRDLMLHSDIATTLKYVKFIQTGDLISSLADEYTRSYLKLTDAGKET